MIDFKKVQDQVNDIQSNVKTLKKEIEELKQLLNNHLKSKK